MEFQFAKNSIEKMIVNEIFTNSNISASHVDLSLMENYSALETKRLNQNNCLSLPSQKKQMNLCVSKLHIQHHDSVRHYFQPPTTKPLILRTRNNNIIWINQ